ncbi:hypothetical protein CR513_06206, partial [Mucuna pruriens]
MEEETSTNDSSFASTNDNDVYYEVVGEAKEKSLEDKVVQLMHNHEKQSEQIRQQSEQIRQQSEKMELQIGLILQYLQLKSLMSGFTLPNNDHDDNA